MINNGLAIRDSLIIGGRTFTDLDNLIILAGYVVGGNYTTVRELNATAGYEVTAGKTLKILAIENTPVDAGSSVDIGYGDDDKGVNAVSSPPTNAVPVCGAIANMDFGASGAYIQRQQAINFEVPEGKFPYIHIAAAKTSSVMLYCYEV